MFLQYLQNFRSDIPKFAFIFSVSTLFKRNMLHNFNKDVSHISLPQQFTFPFSYTPHPLTLLAAEQTIAHLESNTSWAAEIAKGKMFGVMVVTTSDNKLGFIAAFSGLLLSSYHHPFFVPPVYDMLSPSSFFKEEENNISQINKQIKEIENSTSFTTLINTIQTAIYQSTATITNIKENIKTAKKARESRRLNETLSEEESATLIKQSQFEKANLKRIEREWKSKIEELNQQISPLQEKIAQLKKERKTRSALLQNRLFDEFQMLNALGEKKGLLEIFATTSQLPPPAGSGECAGPKMLQYAYIHGLKPGAIAEFWWGASPKKEIRRHKQFYPACMNKCFPILSHMLKGLDVEPSPLANGAELYDKVAVLYQDANIIAISKPHGLASAPGKASEASALDYIKKQFPNASGPLLIHRLDMDTSGILLVALDAETHKIMQSQFASRAVKKKYIALLDGVVETTEGTINLPLLPSYEDRPRQIVDNTNGKSALTDYKVDKVIDGKTRIILYPLTGRTHQLRVHCAHSEGLNCPIFGDPLYGNRSERMYLHAEKITFVHPYLKTSITITDTAKF